MNEKQNVSRIEFNKWLSLLTFFTNKFVLIKRTDCLLLLQIIIYYLAVFFLPVILFNFIIFYRSPQRHYEQPDEYAYEDAVKCNNYMTALFAF